MLRAYDPITVTLFREFERSVSKKMVSGQTESGQSPDTEKGLEPHN